MVRQTTSEGEKTAQVQENPGQSEQQGSTRQPRLHKQKPIGNIPFVGKKLLKAGFDKETVLMVLDAWRPSTKKVYSNYLRKWAVFCTTHNVDILKPTLQQACRFLRTLSQRGLGYGALNAARSALATILPKYDGVDFGKHQIVCWLIKAAYERNPPAPRYSTFWDVSRVFNMLKTWGKNSNLSLKDLSFKVAMLLLLVTAQRGQTIIALSIKDMECTEVLVFKLQKLLKHNRMGDPLDCIKLRPYDQCFRLCVVRAVKEYLNRTKKVRKGETQLLLSFVPPHKAISRDTLARWTLKTLALAGIDTTRYGSHSTRGAAASAAKRVGIPINLILKSAGWKNEHSFARFYDKNLDQDQSEVGPALLGGRTGP